MLDFNIPSSTQDHIGTKKKGRISVETSLWRVAYRNNLNALKKINDKERISLNPSIKGNIFLETGSKILAIQGDPPFGIYKSQNLVHKDCSKHIRTHTHTQAATHMSILTIQSRQAAET